MGIIRRPFQRNLERAGVCKHRGQNALRSRLTMTDNEWNADWAFPPGSLVEELRLERRISLHDLAGMLGLTVPEVLELERGEYPIDALLAERLEYVFGMAEATWLRMELNYRGDLAKGKKVSY